MTADEQAQIATAEDRLVAECMAGHGLRYASRPIHPVPAPANPYGLLTTTDAHSSGYGFAVAAARRTEPDPNQQFVDRLPAVDRDRWHRTLLGTEETLQQIVLSDGSVFSYRSDACTYRAHVRVTGTSWDELYMQVVADTAAFVDSVLADAGVVAARQDWSKCMRGRGYPVGTIAEARQAASNRSGSDERTIATADAQCQQVARLWQAVAAAAGSLERSSDAFRERALRLRDMRAAATDAARGVLAHAEG